MAKNRTQTVPVLRWSVDYAEEKFEYLYPLKRQRDAACRILGEAISVADTTAPSSWNVTLDVQRERIGLNVGQGAVLQLIPDGIYLITTESLLSEPADVLLSDIGHYRYVADNVEGFLVVEDLKHYRRLKRAHHDLIERSAERRSSAVWPQAHSPGVIDYLNRQGFDLSQPEYLTDAEPEVVETADSPLIDRDYADIASTEGRRRLRQHLAPERDSRLAKLKKQQVLQKTGQLACEVCGFDFQACYGELGSGFAEAHHDNPLGGLGRARKTQLDDLRIVCSNCHRMLHRLGDEMSITALKKIITAVQ